MGIQSQYEPLLSSLLSATRDYYGARLVTLCIFGSVARGSATADSDVDFLLIAEDLPKGRIPRVREFDNIEKALATDLRAMEKQDIHTSLSPIIKTPEEVQAGSPLFLDMIFDARILYDREHFFETFLEGLQRRLKKLGAKRIVQGDRWYWDLKPDYRPGDIFEL